MNLIELNRALRQLRLGGIAVVLETRLHQAQAEPMAPIDFLSCLVSDELTRRSERLLERRRKQAQFRDPQKTLDNFDFDFNKKMNRSLVFDLAAATFVAHHEDALFLGPPGTGKSHLAQAIGHAVIGQGYRVIYREAHILLEEIADAAIDGKRKEHMELLATVPLLIIDDLGMRKLAPTAAEELLEIVMRRHERASTLLTSKGDFDNKHNPRFTIPRTRSLYIFKLERRALVKVTRSYVLDDQAKTWWSKDGNSIFFEHDLERSRSALYSVAIADGQIRKISRGDDYLSAFSFDAVQSLAACIRQNPTSPPEISVMEVKEGAPRTLTSLKPEFESITVSDVSELRWKNKFGYETNGYLIKPLNYIEGKRYPLLVVLYYFTRKFFSDAQWIPNYPVQPLAAQGFAVLMVNYPRFDHPRRFGKQGEFVHGYNPLASIESAVKMVVDMGIADPKRNGIMGFSYGCFLTDLTITQAPDLFKVASATDSIVATPGAYWIGGAPHRNIYHDVLGGPPYGQYFKKWLDYSPPLNAHRVHIPVLREFNGTILPIGGLEMFMALKSHGVPVEFVIYPSEPHILSQPVHRFNSMQRNLDWFNFWLQGKEDPDPIKTEQYARWRELRKLQRASLKPDASSR